MGTNISEGAPKTKWRLLIFIVAYNAKSTIRQVLRRIPSRLLDDDRLDVEVLIIDDGSTDTTFETAQALALPDPSMSVTVLQNPTNLGYGGNQKVGYRYALDRGFDLVALLHGDGQYAPEELPRLVQPLLESEADAVFGSRMASPADALRGGMPIYKFLGNKVLTWIQNRLVGTELSEYHSGYRLYSCRALERIPFEANSDGFDFDTDIIIQLHKAGFRIRELPVPTFYGDEICYVNGLQYATAIIWTSLVSRIQPLGLLYDRRFDLTTKTDSPTEYTPKFDFASSHSLALEYVNEDDVLLLLGSGPATLVKPFAEKAAAVTAVDLHIDEQLREIADRVIRSDLDVAEVEELANHRPHTKVLALDVIEHLSNPEQILQSLRKNRSLEDAEYVFTTGNVGFLPLRIMLLLGRFNYGKRGILDKTHTRLFTFSSFTRLLKQSGFEVLNVRGIPAPFPLALPRGSKLGRVLLRIHRLLLGLWPSGLSYQIMVTARARPTTRTLLQRALHHSAARTAELASGSSSR